MGQIILLILGLSVEEPPPFCFMYRISDTYLQYGSCLKFSVGDGYSISPTVRLQRQIWSDIGGIALTYPMQVAVDYRVSTVRDLNICTGLLLGYKYTDYYVGLFVPYRISLLTVGLALYYSYRRAFLYEVSTELAHSKLKCGIGVRGIRYEGLLPYSIFSMGKWSVMCGCNVKGNPPYWVITLSWTNPLTKPPSPKPKELARSIIWGRVVNKLGVPIPGIKVVLKYAHMFVVTSNDGYYQFEVLPGEYVIEVKIRDNVVDSAFVEVPSDTSIKVDFQIEIKASHLCRFRIYDGRDNTPLDSIHIIVDSVEYLATHEITLGLPVGTYIAIFKRHGYYPYYLSFRVQKVDTNYIDVFMIPED